MASPQALKIRSNYSTKDKILFYQQLSILLSSGITLMQGLQLLSKDKRSKFSPICTLLSHSLQQGYPLSTAMQLQKSFFSPLAITLAGAGEKSGQLVFVLEEIANYYKQTEALKGFLLKAALYPALLLSAAFLVLLFFLLYILPAIAATVASLQGTPTPFLQRVLEFKTFVDDHSNLLLATISTSGLLLHAQRDRLKPLLLRLPPFHGLFYSLQEIRFCKLLALLLNSGFSITEGISLAASTLDKDGSSLQLRYFSQKLNQGMGPSAAARCLPRLFSQQTIDFLEIGAASGNMPKMLQEAAKLQEEGLRRRLMQLKELLGPSLLLIAALLTAAVICSALEPLFNLFTAIPEY